MQRRDGSTGVADARPGPGQQYAFKRHGDAPPFRPFTHDGAYDDVDNDGGRGGGGGGTGTEDASPPLPSDYCQDPLVASELNAMATKIRELQASIEALHLTAAEFKSHGDLFDADDFGKLNQVLQQQTLLLEHLQVNYQTLQQLYQTTVMNLEANIARKMDIIRKVDTSLGTISSNNVLCAHFAESGVELQIGLEEAKKKLLSNIRARTAELLASTGASPV